MILLSDTQKYIKTLKLADMVYIGRIDADKSNVVGIYNREKTTHKVIGNSRTYDMAALTVLVHGTTSKSATEKLAQTVYGKLESATGKIGTHKILFFDMLNDAPVDINQDANDVYEYVIDFNIYTER